MKRTGHAVPVVATALLLAGCGGTGDHKPGPVAGSQTAAADSNEEAIK